MFLHLARACITPVILFVRKGWQGAGNTHPNPDLELVYEEVSDRLNEIAWAVRYAVAKKRLAIVTTPDALTGHGHLGGACISALSPCCDLHPAPGDANGVLYVHAAHLVDEEFFQRTSDGRHKTWYYTWDTDAITSKAVARLNRCNLVLTASKWNAEAFVKSGVTTPIRLVPHGVDASLFSPRPLPGTPPFIFGAAGQLKSGGARKHLDTVIAAFQQAFPKDKDVRLHIKVFPEDKLNATDDRIEIAREIMPAEALARWLSGIHWFVSASASEGWGYWPHQALCVGRPIIAPRYSGLQEYWDDHCCFPVPFSEVTADVPAYEKTGRYARVSSADLAKVMVQVKSEASLLPVRSQSAVRAGQRFTNYRFAAELSAALCPQLPTFYHVYCEYTLKDKPTFERVSHARRLWAELYPRGRWVAHPVRDGQLARLFPDANRLVPYVRDLLDTSMYGCNIEDVLVLTNSDVCPNPSLTETLCQVIPTHGAAFGYRRDVDDLQKLTSEQCYTETALYAGVDLVAMTVRWWLDKRHLYPDLLFGTEAWDYVMRLLMQDFGAADLRYQIYHTRHELEGKRNAGSPSQLYNYKVAGEFLKERHLTPYWEQTPRPNMNPADNLTHHD